MHNKLLHQCKRLRNLVTKTKCRDKFGVLVTNLEIWDVVTVDPEYHFRLATLQGINFRRLGWFRGLTCEAGTAPTVSGQVT